jgi:hypothetical protein
MAANGKNPAEHGGIRAGNRNRIQAGLPLACYNGYNTSWTMLQLQQK